METIQSTKDLIAYLSSEDKPSNYSIVRIYVDTILDCGSKADADVLLPCFLEEPDDFYRSDLLRVIRAFGDVSVAPQLAEKCFHNGMLIENVPEDVLEILGYFRYEPFKPVLADYAFGKIQSDYYGERAAVLGLLHFDCTEYRELILQEIEKCYGQGVFPEFIPALVCKLDEPRQTETLAKLYELGTKYASTDCNAGIILGFSLCGEAGRSYFERILFDKNWECCDSGTGSIHFTYRGINHLEIDFKELYERVLAVENTPELSYHVEIFLELLQRRIEDQQWVDLNDFVELFNLLFASENPNKRNHFWTLLECAELREEGCQTEKMLIRKLKELAILSNFKS